ASVLGRSDFGRHDNFFALGGDSLRATQVVSRIRTEFGVELRLRSLFENTSVATLALAIDEARHSEAIAIAALLDEIDALPEHEVQARFSAFEGGLE
ncbi:phosphopantetheine-binding protein, partial [Bradyrhizobium liaoningense]